MGFIHRNGLAVRGLFPGGGSHFREHRCLKLRTRPYFGHARDLGQRRHLRRFGYTGSGRLRRSARHACLRRTWHLWHAGHLRRSTVGQGKPLPFHFMPFNHRLAQILDFHRRHLPRSSRSLRTTSGRLCGRRRGRGQYGGFFLDVIEQNRLLRRGVRNYARRRGIEPKLTITRLPHAGSRLRRCSSARRLRLGRAIRTGRWRRRRC